MPIYSANRTGLGTGNISESVNPMDIGQILYENQLNDMAIFQAVIRNDYGEICRLREGTMLECEMQALTEGAVKGFFKNVQENLSKFWNKIKRAFNEVIDKLSLLFGPNGAKAVRAFEQEIKALGGLDNFTGEVEVKIANLNLIKALDPSRIKAVDKIRAEVSAHNDGNKGDFGKEFIEKELGALVNGGSMSVKDYTERLFEDAFRDVTINKSNVSKLTAIVSGGKDIIKGLKNSQKTIETDIYNVSKELKKAERDIEDNANEKINVRNISAIVSAYETIVGVQSRTAIAIAKQSVKNGRVGLQKVLAEIRKKKKEDKVYNNSAILVAESEVDDVFSNNLALYY